MYTKKFSTSSLTQRISFSDFAMKSEFSRFQKFAEKLIEVLEYKIDVASVMDIRSRISATDALVFNYI